MIKSEFFINTTWRSKLSVDFVKSPWRNVMPTSCMACMLLACAHTFSLLACMVACMCPCIFVIFVVGFCFSLGLAYALITLLSTEKNWVAFKEKPNLSPRVPKTKGCSTSFFRGLPGAAFEFWPNFLQHLPRGDTMPPKKVGVRLESLSSFGGIFFPKFKEKPNFQLIFWKHS